MAMIQVTPELLTGKATEMRGLKAQHDEVMSRMTTLVNGLSEIWKGSAQDAYYAKYQSMQSTFTQFSETLEGFAKLMDSVAATMGDVDGGLANDIGSL